MIDFLSYFLILSGLFFILVSVIGCHRLPGYFSKMHAATIGEVVGSPLFIFGLALQSKTLNLGLKIALLSLLLLIINPTASYILNRIALKKGMNIDNEEQ